MNGVESQRTYDVSEMVHTYSFVSESIPIVHRGGIKMIAPIVVIRRTSFAEVNIEQCIEIRQLIDETMRSRAKNIKSRRFGPDCALLIVTF